MNQLRNVSVKVPTLAQWNKKFKMKGSMRYPRATLADMDTATQALSRLQLPHPEKMTVVEIYPGLGTWTAALANAGFKKILALEPQQHYYKHMMDVKTQAEDVIVPIKKDGYDWSTYVELKKPEYLGHLERPDWSTVHPEILFTGTLPKSSVGEQLLAQFASCIVNKMALHTLGRIQMALWMPDMLYRKFVAPPASSNRCKMSVVAEASADVKSLYSATPNVLYPHEEYHLVHIVPRATHKLTAQWDVFEYVLKHLFVMQKQPLSKIVK
ncbi:ribosomal RNA adenine methyltransferase KsgA/Erm [Radiomyces spectabilis]|uniref:ribosomal RNA adenine methyltransferase KsgA/Erm n=1 Tax=Radiomyces spectabilis TaxID=64574 RepID=UPI0022205288|nr:ribosomal RNA adenine methyltransferase KsgA/Erm [Radiomyces spectabilis]KAI8381147.1 ribosomal RNA adenine methyltransferase KsgA/Erm [Radiomyces spectabilis]